MNLLYVIHYPVFGGPHNEALRLNGPLASRGVRLTVLLPDEPGDAAPRLRTAGIDTVQIPLHRLRAVADPLIHFSYFGTMMHDVRRIRRVIHDRQIDLVQIGGLVNPHAGLAARREGVPVAWQVVDSRPPRMLRLLCMIFVRRLANVIMFDGKALIELHTRKQLNVPHLVYFPPVDTKRFRPSTTYRSEVRKELNIPEAAPVVGTVANISPQKGLEFFIEAAAQIRRTAPDARFIVVGPRFSTHTAYSQLLDKKVQDLGMDDRLFFIGGRSDVERYYAAMDVHLITSVPNSEGTTTTAMEAMACGIPVVASDVAAISEVIEEGKTGYLTRPCDSLDIAQTVLKLLLDRSRRAEMSTAAVAHSRTHFDVEVAVERYMEAFHLALNNRQSQ